MKQQTIGLLLSALLLTTFGHEHLRAHHLSQQNRLSHHQQQQQRHAHIQNRAETTTPSDETCSLVCTGTGNGSLTVVINETTSIIGIVNITANVAIAIDINANLVAVFNGTSGAVVIINIEKHTGIVISGSSNAGLWISSRISFEAYINSLSSLTVIWQLGLKIGTSFTQVTTQALQIIASVLIRLSVQYAVQLQVSISGSFDLLIQFSTRITVLFNGSLKGFLRLTGSAALVIRSDILWFVGVLEGIGTTISQIRGGIQVLIQNNIRFSWSELLVTSRNGVDVFVYIVRTIQVHIDISTAFSGVFTNIQTFLEIIVRLNGNVSAGFSGFIQVIYELVAVANRNGSATVLVDFLINYSISRNASADYSVEFTESINALITLTQSANSSTTIQAFTQVLISIREQRWIVGSINISRIIQVLGNARTASLDLIVSVLYSVREVIAIEITITQLILSILVELNSSFGITVVIGLVPSLREVLSSQTNIVAYIISHINLVAIIHAGFNLEKVLEALPIIGDIVKAVSASLRTASNGSFSLTIVFKASSSNSIVIRIWAWLKATLNIKVSWSTSESTRNKGIHHEHEAAKEHHGVHAKHHVLHEKHHASH